MVMAGNDSTLSHGVDESLSTKLQLLRQRREILEEKLAQKNNELKNLCIAEAELTGVLPPETPLEPGESPPVIHHRNSVTFPQSQNFSKLKTSEADELEIERQIQIRLAEAALKIINDSNENRTARRKQRSIYQQCQRKLQELDTRLNFIKQGTSLRQTHGLSYSGQSCGQNNIKHRTKKPRPPLSGSVRETHVKPLHEQGGVSLSPLGSEHNYNRYPNHEYPDRNCRHTPPNPNIHGNHARIPYLASSPVDCCSNTKFTEHEQNINNNVYVLPDQLRSRGQNRFYDDERLPHFVSNTYAEDERSLQYRQIQEIEQEPVVKQYVDYRYIDNDGQHRPNQPQCGDDFYNPTYPSTYDYHGYCKNQPQQVPLSRQRREQDTISVVDGRTQQIPRQHTVDYSPPGYWVRQNGEIVWYPEDKYVEKFGSLDRRKHNSFQNTGNIEMQSRYHTVGTKNSSSSLRQPQVNSPNGNLEQPTPFNRILRTQSLGSVETRQHRESPDEKNSIEAGRKGKEKDWYETSLDANCSPHPVSTLRSSGSTRSERRYDPLVSNHKDAAVSYREVRPTQIQTRPTERMPLAEQQSPLIPHQPVVQNRYYEPPKTLEIPAESSPHQENGNEVTIPLASPTNHTIVQPGKYQPYREVTKPFEMSDFYKYSTKFRKRNEANQMAAALASLGEKPAVENSAPSNIPLVKNRVHQPLQRKTGQYYDLR